MKTFALLILMVCVALGLFAAQRGPKPGKGTVARTIQVGDRSRAYYLHAPAGRTKGRPLALVLMFHGGGGLPAFAEQESKFSELADREGFLVAYPEGVGKSWNDGRGVNAIPAQRDDVDDLAFVTALIDDIDRDFPVDANRVYATGISNGGIFSQYLAVRLASRIAAIAPVAAGIPEPLRGGFHPEKPVSVLIYQGTADPLVPYGGGNVTILGTKRGNVLATDEAVKKWVEHDGCSAEAVIEDLPDKDPNDGCRVTKFTYANGKGGSEVTLYRVKDGGHAWPNGKQYLSQATIGKVCRDVDGAEIIWEFFKAHPRP